MSEEDAGKVIKSVCETEGGVLVRAHRRKLPKMAVRKSKTPKNVSPNKISKPANKDMSGFVQTDMRLYMGMRF